jgi:hypothetical protein
MELALSATGRRGINGQDRTDLAAEDQGGKGRKMDSQVESKADRLTRREATWLAARRGWRLGRLGQRWRRLLTMLAWTGLISGWPLRRLWAQVVDRMGDNSFATAQRQVTLKDILAKELRARRPNEFRFIETVVEMVDQGELPLRMVRSSFLWARNRRPYPLVYFEQSLKRQAAAAGISIPASVLVRR